MFCSMFPGLLKSLNRSTSFYREIEYRDFSISSFTNV